MGIAAKINPEDETKLLIELKSGEEPAFEKIYKLYSHRIYGNILKMVKSEDDAEELLQDVFLKVWNKKDSIDPEQSFRSYLFQISKFAVYDFIRKNNREKQLKDYLSRENTELYSHIEEGISFKQSDKLINEIIEALPAQRKQIYKLCKVEGKSYREVSSLLGISTSTINDHIVKATKFIKDRHSAIDGTIVLAVVSILLKDIK